MTRVEFVCSDEKSVALLKAARLFDEGVECEPVRHGHWINKTKMLHGAADYRFDCSVCGHIFWHSSVETFKYCPWCGAKMDGDEHAAD